MSVPPVGRIPGTTRPICRARACPRRRRPKGGACLPLREGGPPQDGPEGCVTGSAGHPQVCFAHLRDTPQLRAKSLASLSCALHAPAGAESRLPPCQLPSKGSPCDPERQGTVRYLHFPRQRTVPCLTGVILLIDPQDRGPGAILLLAGDQVPQSIVGIQISRRGITVSLLKELPVF